MATSTLKKSVTPTALLQAEPQAESITQPSVFHRFMELPIEIRLLIYNELVVQNGDLYRAECPLCAEREPLACTQILRTSKEIYSEVLPVLYSKNTVHLTCRECEKSNFSNLSVYLPEWNGLPLDTIDHYNCHVRNIAIVFDMSYYKQYNRACEFPALWLSMENAILACYKNTEHISLHTRSYHNLNITLDLVRRSCKSKTQHVSDYGSVLAQHAAQNLSTTNDDAAYAAVQMAWAALEELCDRLIISEVQGGSKDTVLAVRYLGVESHGSSLFWSGMDPDESLLAIMVKETNSVVTTVYSLIKQCAPSASPGHRFFF